MNVQMYLLSKYPTNECPKIFGTLKSNICTNDYIKKYSNLFKYLLQTRPFWYMVTHFVPFWDQYDLLNAPKSHLKKQWIFGFQP